MDQVAPHIRGMDDWKLDFIRECKLFPQHPRYTLTMFPIFILFGLLSQNRFWAGVLTVWSLLFFALFAVLFARGEWAF